MCCECIPLCQVGSVKMAVRRLVWVLLGISEHFHLVPAHQDFQMSWGVRAAVMDAPHSWGQVQLFHCLLNRTAVMERIVAVLHLRSVT